MTFESIDHGDDEDDLPDPPFPKWLAATLACIAGGIYLGMIIVVAFYDYPVWPAVFINFLMVLVIVRCISRLSKAE